MRRKLGEILLGSGVVGPGDIAEALGEQSAGEPARLGDLLVARGKLSPAQLAQALAEQYGVPFTMLPPLPTAVLEAVPFEFQRAHRLVPIRVDGTTLSVAMADLSDADAVASLKKDWPQVVVLAAPADEIDALHASLSGEAPAPRSSPSGPRKPLVDELFGSLDLESEPVAAAPQATASALFGDLNLDDPAPPAATPSAEFDLTPSIESSPSVAPSNPSGMFELSVEAPAERASDAFFDLSMVLEPGAEEPALDLTSEVELPPEDAAPSAPRPPVPAPVEEEEEESLFYEAQLTSPSPAPIAPPPVVAPVVAEAPAPPPMPEGPPAVAPVGAEALPDLGELVFTEESPAPPPAGPPSVAPAAADGLADLGELVLTEESEAPALAEFLDGLPEGEPVPPLRDDTFAPGAAHSTSVLEQLFISPEEPVAPAAPTSPPEPVAAHAPKVAAHAPKPSPAKPPAEKVAPALKPAPRVPPHVEKPPAEKPPAKAAQDDLPDWLRGDAAAGEPAAPLSTDLWTGELETLAPSKLITGVARALIRKGILTEQDVLEALERKKS